MRRRLVVALALALALGAAVSAAARAADPMKFWITKYQAATEYPVVNAPDVSGETYDVLAPWQPEQAVTVDGFSLAAGLAGAGVSRSDFALALIALGAGQYALIDAAEATRAPGDGRRPPVFWKDDKYLHYADSDPTHYVAITPPTMYSTVELYPGHELEVEASVPTRAEEGVPTTMTATATGTSAPVSFQWIHAEPRNGGSLGFGASFTRRFAAPGTYHVRVLAKGDDGSVGLSPIVAIEVGEAPPGEPDPGGGSSPTPGPIAAAESGEESGEESEGTTGGRGRGGPGRSQRGDGKRAGGDGDGPRAGRDSGHLSGPAGGGGEAGGAADTGGTGSLRAPDSDAHPGGAGERRSRSQPRPRPQGPLLTGVALADAPAAAAAGGADGGAASGGGDSDEAQQGNVLDVGGISLVLVVLAVIGAGAWLEHKGPPRVPAWLRNASAGWRPGATG